jgi:D-lyxose ketol-isomerase/sugar/nucleoside kinase (ribokinase family)
MKRSEIDRVIREGLAFLGKMGVCPPPRAYWGLEEWHEHREEAPEPLKRGIGWDITDFGRGNFSGEGLLLYTLSNGYFDPATGKPVDQTYANKLLIVGKGQVSLTHHHWRKVEDIIVLGGGDLKIELHNAGPGDELDRAGEVRIMRNSVWRTHPAGAVVTLTPGERVRLERRHYHKFWGHRGKVLVEEVSTVNDDATDNCFLPGDRVGRFPEIEEDQEPEFLLCTELPGSGKFDRLYERYLNRHDVLVLNTSVVDIRSPDFDLGDKLAGRGGVRKMKTDDAPGFSQERILEWIEGGLAAAGGPGNCAPLMAGAGLKTAVGANLGRGAYPTGDGRLRLDAAGRFFYDVLYDNGVSVVEIVLHRRLPTGTAYIHDSSSRERGGIVYYPGANDVFSFQNARRAVSELMPQVVYYMYSGLSIKGDANRGEDLARFMRWCQRKGALTIADSHTLTGDPRAVTASGRPVKEYRLLKPLLPCLDVFFTSSGEAGMIANTLSYLGLKGSKLKGHEYNLRFLESLLKNHPAKNNKTRLFGLTVKDGAYFTAVLPDRTVQKPRKVKSRHLSGRNVDLVGAGDAFRAGLITHIVNNLKEFKSGKMDFVEAVQAGNLFASLYIKAPLDERYKLFYDRKDAKFTKLKKEKNK